jgi:hypothetical protein
LAGPCPRSGQFSVKQPTVLLTVLTQTPPFRGLTTDAGSVGDVLEALMQSDGADVGVAPGCQRWLGPRLD